jgi:hypothetical protein
MAINFHAAQSDRNRMAKRLAAAAINPFDLT